MCSGRWKEAPRWPSMSGGRWMESELGRRGQRFIGLLSAAVVGDGWVRRSDSRASIIAIGMDPLLGRGGREEKDESTQLNSTQLSCSRNGLKTKEAFIIKLEIVLTSTDTSPLLLQQCKRHTAHSERKGECI